jgi:hypothetical protein
MYLVEPDLSSAKNVGEGLFLNSGGNLIYKLLFEGVNLV